MTTNGTKICEVERVTAGGVTTYVPVVNIEEIRRRKEEIKEQNRKEKERLDALAFAESVKEREEFDREVALQTNKIVEMLVKQDKVTVTFSNLDLAKAVACTLESFDVSIVVGVKPENWYRSIDKDLMSVGTVLLIMASIFLGFLAICLVGSKPVETSLLRVILLILLTGIPGLLILALSLLAFWEGFTSKREFIVTVTGL